MRPSHGAGQDLLAPCLSVPRRPAQPCSHPAPAMGVHPRHHQVCEPHDTVAFCLLGKGEAGWDGWARPLLVGLPCVPALAPGLAVAVHWPHMVSWGPLNSAALHCVCAARHGGGKGPLIGPMRAPTPHWPTLPLALGPALTKPQQINVTKQSVLSFQLTPRRLNTISLQPHEIAGPMAAVLASGWAHAPPL